MKEFSELCKFYIFMKGCQIDYVGSTDISWKSYVREVCNNISKLHQVWRDEKEKEVIDTSKDLFQKFIKLAVSLPDNMETWTFQLPSQYLALDEKIKKKITVSSFSIPKPSKLCTKLDQINWTRLIKNKASTIFDDLEERRVDLHEKKSLMAKTVQPRNPYPKQISSSRFFCQSNIVSHDLHVIMWMGVS